MAVAQVSWNPSQARWEATFGGRVIASNRNFSGGVDYLRRVIEGGFSQKAKNLGIDKIEVLQASTALSNVVNGTMNSDDELAPEPLRSLDDEFPINERFAIMTDYVEMVAEKQLASTIVTGEGGLGKSFTVMRTLRACGLEDTDKYLGAKEIGSSFDGFRGYKVIKGYSTAKGLYRTLYEYRNQIVVFDDCDSILKDANAVNVLKAALDSYDVRIVSWNAESMMGDDDLPRSFEFTGGVIFISNLPKYKVPQAIRSRAMCADVSMSRDEVIERMQVIIESDEFMPNFSMEHKREALQFVSDHRDDPLIAELNLRSLVNAVKAREAKPDSWERLALYSMANS
jgi:hypothetical protein